MSERLESIPGSEQWLQELETRDKSELIEIIKELQKETLIDQMTGLSNRKHFDQVLDQELSMLPGTGVKRVKERKNLALLMIDLNDLKTINDEFGHVAGNMAIIAVGKILDKSLRKTDLKARWGGDEFGAILTNVSLETLQIIFKKVQKAVSQIVIEDFPEVRVSVSIGGTLQSESKHSAMDLFEKADSAMYLAKNSGGNRIMIDFDDSSK